MQKHKLLWTMALITVSLPLFPSPAYAYIDPGTTGSIFAVLAPFIAILLGFLGFLVRPFRRFFACLVAKLRGNREPRSPTANEQPIHSEPANEEQRKGRDEGLKD